MNKRTSIALLIATALVGGPSAAAAQTAPPTKNIFVDVNFGAQPASQIFELQTTPVVYGENAIITSKQGVNGSALLDVTAGYRVWRDLSIALGLTTTFSSGGDAEVLGAIPHPIFFDRRVESTVAVTDLAHKERSAHISAVWTSPVTDKIDASVAGGPSYIKVFQDLVTGVTVPAGTQNFVPAAEQSTATVFGFHFGGDVTYLITPRLGGGVMVRYVIGHTDLGPVHDVKVGGFQYALGLRVRF
jgi:hypothetical protein